MAKRLITGFVLAPLVIFLILYAPKPVLYALLGAAAAQAVDELVRMFPPIRPQDRAVLALLAVLAATSPLLGGVGLWLATSLLPIVWLSVCLVQPQTVEAAAKRAALGMLGLGYVAPLVGVMIALFARGGRDPAAQWNTGRGALLALLVMVFAGDTGAYFAGRGLGRHKLYALISPKKTLEGAVGGLCASCLGGYLTHRWFLPQLGLGEGILLGAACGAVGQIGDLAESLFKRATGTKDSGGLLPGHGGLLDRIDGVLFAAPIVQAWLILR